MFFTKTVEGWKSSDNCYTISEVTDPWGGSPTEPLEWIVRVQMYTNSWTRIATAPTLDNAMKIAQDDDALPVLDFDRCCRWCRTEDSTRFGFGCRLCHPDPQADDLSWQDLEEFDDPA